MSQKEPRETKGQRIYSEVTAEKFPNLRKETDIQVQKAQRTPNKKNLKRSTTRRIISNMSRIKERILKAARERQQVTYKGNPIKQSADFCAETLQARREWHSILKSAERRKPTVRNTLSSKVIILNGKKDKELFKHTKSEGVHHH